MTLDNCMYLCIYVFMRTTIDLPTDIFRKAKAISSLKGITLKNFITMALEHELEVNAVGLEPRKAILPLIPSRNPGTIQIDSSKIAELIEREDAGVRS
jgi:hypothetical protein